MSNPLDQVGRRAVARPDRIGQATAVEQARAVAEVAAAVQVAQQFPRDMDRVIADIREACAELELAQEAFYAVQNRGEGLSVHLARELARIFGNFQYGVHELRRDDDAGESEVQAFAWDVETNTRSSRTFVNPHIRMKNGQRQALIDIQDIYLSNQNTGARAVRETILSALPKKVVRMAEKLLRERLAQGTGQPAAERAAEAVTAFGRFSVSKQQLVARLGGREPADWSGEDFATLAVIFGSLNRGETTVGEQFPDAPPVTAQEITGGESKVTARKLQDIVLALADRNIETPEGRREALEVMVGRPLADPKDLTRTEAADVLARLQAEGPPTPADGEQQQTIDEPPADGES